MQKKEPVKKLVMMQLSQLIPYERNNKKHGENVKRIADSIKRNEYISPIVADEQGVILAGHGRKLALESMGVTEEEILVVEGLTEKQKADFRIADNRTSELSERDLDAVLAEIEEFGLEELKIDFPDLEFEEDKELEEIEDDVPSMDNVKIIVEKGDIFQLGEHRLMCGDSTNIEDMEALMNGEKADMVFTDPPYGYRYESNHQDQHDMLMNDDKMLDFLPTAISVSKKDISVYVCTSYQVVKEWMDIVKRSGLEIKNLIVRKKNNWSMGDLEGSYAGQHEIIIYAHYGRDKLRNGRDRDVWEFDREPPALHPTMKPIGLSERAIYNTSDNGYSVLDPFLGSGSTLIACEKTNRKCYGMELDPKYIQVILKRYHDYTKGQKEVKCISREINLSPILQDGREEE